MKPAPFDYYAPTTIEEACTLLAEAGGGATVLAGGQTLMPLLALRMSQPFILVDINRIEALKGVDSCRRCNAHRSRSCARTRSSPTQTLARVLPVLVTATRHVGHHQTRNRGTIGGSIALGEPAAELPATAVALGASIEARSVRGARRIRADEMYLGPYATALEPDELITAIEFPDWPADTIPLFREVAQRPGRFRAGRAGRRAALSRTDASVARASPGSAWARRRSRRGRRKPRSSVSAVAELDVQAIAELAVADTAPFDDRHASAEYRRTVGRRIFARTLAKP